MALPPTPMPFTAAPLGPPVEIGGQPAGTIQHFAPTVNVPSFGMCNSPTNPAVIAATAAALGVHTPAPCIPAPASPWAPGQPDVLINGTPALTASCQLTCTWAGVITVASPGQATVTSA
jgi:hypothetical protein